MIEYLAPSFLYSVLKDALATFRSRRRRLTPSEVVAARTKWKAEFEPRIAQNHRRNLRKDVIIRDMKRIDSYPNLDDGKGISPWFRADVVGTYHRGILVGLSYESLKKHGNGERWRKTDYRTEETGDINVLLIGSIPFENIDNVDWDGDEFYPYPHIYCFFSHRRGPCEHLGYYSETVPSHGFPFYTEVTSYEQVRKLTMKLGIDN